MNELIVKENMLPANIEDVAKFVLIGTEKLNALRAEIKAIQKLKLAEEVYRQKLEEQRMLSNLIIDAMYKVGEFTQNLPTATQGNQYTGKMVSSSNANDQKPKGQVIKELGFSKDQVSRFELMADNHELVEQAKAQARENDECITQTKVIDFIKTQKQHTEEQIKEGCNRIDSDYAILKEYRKSIYEVTILNVDRDNLEACGRSIDDISKDSLLNSINIAIDKLQKLKIFLANNKTTKGFRV